jgi:hypothetical protein
MVLTTDLLNEIDIALRFEGTGDRGQRRSTTLRKPPETEGKPPPIGEATAWSAIAPWEQ